jgi:NADPH-dependent curcumin reductase CurA
MDEWPSAVAQLARWVSDGKIKPLETIRTGLEALPGALVDLFRGGNIGKMIVEIAEAQSLT